MENVIQKLKNLDAYPKINDDFYSRSLTGGVITVFSGFFIILLFLSEFRLYLHTVTETKLLVDTARGEKLRIHFNVSFHEVPCTLLSIDSVDISGERHIDIRHDITKKRINSHGNVVEVRQDGIGAPKIERPLQRHGGRLDKNETYCGSCYGAEESDEHCCNSCDEVRLAYRKRGWGITNIDMIDQCKREGFVLKVKEEEGEGCNIHGSLEVSKVAGSFYFAAGKTFHHSDVHLRELIAIQNTFNISHTINKLTFGDEFPGVINPLDGVQWMHQTSNGMYQYFVKVVPTTYTDIRGRTIKSNQYSVTEHFMDADMANPNSLTGAFFFYDLSPIKVIFKEEHTPFLHFMTHICAIIGGIFTVAGIVDAVVYHGQKVIKKKAEIGTFR